jgi:anti-anti-sigma factor
MGKAAEDGEVGLRVYPVDHFEHLKFVDVNGELLGAASRRWSGLLSGAIEERAEGIVVDLRGCGGIDPDALKALLAAAATLKARGGSGVALVLLPGSSLAQRLRLLAGDELRICDSAGAALRALGNRRLPVPLARVEREGEVAVIAVTGEFDHAGGVEFGAALDDALALEAPLIVDLEHCEFIDSIGMALLVRAYRGAEHGFALAASGPQVHRVLDLIGIPEYLPTWETRRDAVTALGP